MACGDQDIVVARGLRETLGTWSGSDRRRECGRWVVLGTSNSACGTSLL